MNAEANRNQEPLFHIDQQSPSRLDEFAAAMAVRQHLVSAGFVAPESTTGSTRTATRKAKAAHCRRCGLAVVVGLDADMCAIAVALDPRALDTWGAEIAALVAGNRTYTIHRFAREIDYRDRWERAARPPEPLSPHSAWSVHAAHACPHTRSLEGPR